MGEKEIIINCIETGRINDLSAHINMFLDGDATLHDCYKVIECMENYYISNNASYLSGFLFRLYDLVGDASMARYYLQYCYEDYSQQSKYYSLIDKYIQIEPSFIRSNYEQYDSTYEYEYDGLNKEYSVHSFSNKIGQNLTLLITPYGSLIFDCGAYCHGNKQDLISKNDLVGFLNAFHVQVKDIKGVFISHAHLDHYGSIRVLQSIGIPSIRFYSDERTKKIIMTAAGEDLLKDARPVSSFFVAGQKVRVHAFDNGHIVGSQAYVVHFDNITVLYSGDFCLHDQLTVKGWNLSKLIQDSFVVDGVDCLITESTYGQRASEILPYDDALKVFEHLTEKLIKNGYKVFLPAFAVGRSQELALLASKDNKVLIDGLAINMTQVMDSLVSSKVMNGNVKFSVFGEEKIDNFDLNDVIIASSGMIAENSTSAGYMEALFNSERRIAIIRTGYMDSSEESYGYEQLKKWQDKDRLLLDISLSAHANYNELIYLIEQLSPKNVVAVHGSGILHTKEITVLSQKKELSRNVPDAFDEETTHDVLAEDKIGIEKEDTGGVTITDAVTIGKWKNLTKVGAIIRANDGVLEYSQPFITSLKMLIKYLKRKPEYSRFVDRINSIGGFSSLLDYLIATEKNGFVLLPEEKQDTISDAKISAQQVGDINGEISSDGERLYVYRCIDEQNCEISKGNIEYPKELVLPDYSPDMKKVIRIADNAFSNSITVEKITIPDSVSNIGKNAFSGCSRLVEINLPNFLKEIKSQAFLDCTSLSRLRLPENLKIIGETAFANCSKLTELVVPEGVRFIGNAAFLNCSNLVVRCPTKKQSDGWAPAWATLVGNVVFSDAEGNPVQFGEQDIPSKLIKEYTQAAYFLYNAFEKLRPDHISMLKGMCNRCLRHDQMDWITTYNLIGTPPNDVLVSFVNDAPCLRDQIKRGDYSGVEEFRTKHEYILRNVYKKLCVDVDFAINVATEDNGSQSNKPSQKPKKKYRIHELAKDLNVSAKSVANILQKYGYSVKNFMQVLTVEEISLVLECFTQENQIDDIRTLFKQNTSEKLV